MVKQTRPIVYNSSTFKKLGQDMCSMRPAKKPITPPMIMARIKKITFLIILFFVVMIFLSYLSI